MPNKKWRCRDCFFYHRTDNECRVSPPVIYRMDCEGDTSNGQIQALKIGAENS
jgi:hypothetical protein